MFIKLMKEFIGILLSESVFEFLFVFGIDKMSIFFAHLPLFSRAELPYCREAPSFVSVVFRHVLVCSQLHFEVKLCFIWLSQIISSRDQMLKLSRITSIVKIKDSRGIIALSGLSPLKNLIE
jgi:hypothetical protein